MSHRLLTLLMSWSVMVAVGSTAGAATPTGTGSAPGVSRTVHDTSRTAAVGALFHGPAAAGTTVSPAALGEHFCSAGVVASPRGNEIVTAAHCLTGGGGGEVYFVPGYHVGSAPYGVWKVDRVTVDRRWSDGQDPDLDVAFATVDSSGGRQVQEVVGGYALGTGRAKTAQVRLTGYPSAGEAPLTCVNRTAPVGAGQLRIACTGYSGGTSGSPWVTRDDHRVIGVIGGYEQGGDSPDVSYTSYFGADVAALYRQAIAG
jgi:V8-like Glu-specific endopeptidase